MTGGWKASPLDAEVQAYLDQLLAETAAAQSVPPDRMAEAATSPVRNERIVPRRTEHVISGHEQLPRQAAASSHETPTREFAEPLKIGLQPFLPAVAPTVHGTEKTVSVPDGQKEQREQKEKLPQAAKPVSLGGQQEPFEALLFRAGGLTLAVPLKLLGAIRPLDAMPTPLPGQPEWYMGVLPAGEHTLQVVDTAQVVMPERYDPTMRSHYRYVISVYGSAWALAVDEILNAETLQPSQVRWRGRQSRRPWLAGTVVDHMCALLDVAGLDALLKHRGGNAPLPEAGP